MTESHPSAWAEVDLNAITHNVRLLRAALRPPALRVRCFCLEFVASAFLHHMVRNIIGALVMAGSGAKAPEWVAEILTARVRAHAAPTFMPDGLYLSGIEYDPCFGLPATASRHPWKPNS